MATKTTQYNKYYVVFPVILGNLKPMFGIGVYLHYKVKNFFKITLNVFHLQAKRKL